MATAKKRKLSGSTDGKPILIAAVATPGTVIHTAVSGTTDGTYDEIWLWANNNNSSSVEVIIEYGSVDSDDNISRTIPPRSGLFPLIPGLPLQNGLVVRAFAAIANVVSIVGFVNTITD